MTQDVMRALLSIPEACSQVPNSQESGREESEYSPSVDEAFTLIKVIPKNLGKPRPREKGLCNGATSPALNGIPDDDVLLAIEARCRLKAECVRWAVSRRQLRAEGADFRVAVAPRDRDLFSRAGELHCYLWMNKLGFAAQKDQELVVHLAGCFVAVADSVALVRIMLHDREAKQRFFGPALNVLAESQSALRVAIERIGGPKDRDQLQVYEWLCAVTARLRIYINRHMKIDAHANTTLLPQLKDHIESLDTSIKEFQRRAKTKQSLLNRLHYHAKLIAEGTGGEHDWWRVAETTDEMIGQGVQASSIEIREVLLPILHDKPDMDALPPGFGLALREIDRYLAGRMPVTEATSPDVPTAEVTEAARLLSGKTVVLIGGDRRPEVHERLEANLSLNELVWVETRKHESVDKFEPYVARPEVAVVLLAIRWASHSYGEVKQSCDRYGKPLVRLPGGYNPNQVAAQILAQCSGQLESRLDD